MTAIEGDAGKPAVFFVHGLGMDKNIWVSPDQSKILGGMLPVSLILATEPELKSVKKGADFRNISKLSLGGRPRRLTTLFHTLRDLGYTVITWSQQRPAAEIRIAALELRSLLSMHAKYCGSGIILMGHSRGGLVAREYLRNGDGRVRALITISTPHKGSNMARWAKYLIPLVSVVNPLLSRSEKGTLKFTVKRVFDFLQSAAVREMLPGSHFFRALDDGRIKGTYYLSLGGSSPTLFSVYRNFIERIPYGDSERTVLRAQKFFSVPDIFETIIPARLYPDEMKRGKGDGLVSLESSRIPWADDHLVFDVNHAGILFDERVKSEVIEVLTVMK